MDLKQISECVSPSQGPDVLGHLDDDLGNVQSSADALLGTQML